MTEREAYIALNMMQGVGPIGVRALVAALGSARGIFEADEKALTAAEGVGPRTAREIVRQRAEVDWSAEQARAAELGARIVAQIDEEYPRCLREIHDPPLALYVEGALEARDQHAIAVVGTRRPTNYGRETAGRLAGALARAGFTVVSGLAEGIDTAAHQGALRAKGRTLAVLGSPLDAVYPTSNRELARTIAGEGAVMTELPLGRQADKTTFPMRNRIVSGLSRGVLVVEAGAKSGALITAREAAEQGRSVFAVPGRIDSPASVGCHELIKQGARLVVGIDDVLQEFEFLIPPGAKAAVEEEVRPRPKLSEEEIVLTSILEKGEQDVDSLIRASGFDAAKVNALLLGLEMKRLIRMLPGRVVEAVGQRSETWASAAGK